MGCDVRHLDDVEAGVAATAERFGRLDICVANAGVGSYHTLVDTPLEHIEEMIDVNLKGTIYAIRASIPHLIESGEGDIVTVASEAGRRGLPGEAVYCASKFGQVGLTRASTTSCASTGSAARTSAPAVWRRTSRLQTATGVRRKLGRDDVGRRRCGSRRVLPHAPASAPHPRDGVAADDGALVGMTPIRLGILSTAHINRLVIPGAHASDKVELVAVASRERSRAEEYARKWNIERAYGPYEALLDDPEVDAVYISSRTPSTANGRSEPSRRASTSSARSR